MTLVWAALFILTVTAFWFLNLLGLPGNWLIAGSTVLYAWLMPPDSRFTVPWPAVGVVAALAVLGELAEMVASAAGVRRAGGTRLGAFLALVGSVVGAFVGLFVGVPIPVVGSLVAAVLFGGAGALCGAMLGEHIHGRDYDTSVRVGQAAFWGRLAGTFVKALIGAVMAGVAIAAACV